MFELPVPEGSGRVNWWCVPEGFSQKAPRHRRRFVKQRAGKTMPLDPCILPAGPGERTALDWSGVPALT